MTGSPSTVVHVAGPRGAGSSTVAFALFTSLVGDGRCTGYADLSQLQMADPPPSADAVARNLGVLWAGYRAVGADTMVVAGRPDARLPGATLVWLTVDRPRHLERLAMRGRGLGPPIPGDDLRGRPEVELASLADRSFPIPQDADIVLDTSALTAQQCAERLRLAADRSGGTG